MSASPKGAALVTGAAKRIGRALALALAEDGYDIAIHFHSSADEAESAAAAVRAHGRRCALVRANLAREDETARVIDAAVKGVGPLRILVNSASAFEADDLFTMTRAIWDRHIETNLRAPLKLIQDFARAADPLNALTVNVARSCVDEPMAELNEARLFNFVSLVMPTTSTLWPMCASRSPPMRSNDGLFSKERSCPEPALQTVPAVDGTSSPLRKALVRR